MGKVSAAIDRRSPSRCRVVFAATEACGILFARLYVMRNQPRTKLTVGLKSGGVIAAGKNRLTSTSKLTMPALTNLRELLVDELRDLHNAENQLVKALPKMAKAASHEELKSGFEEHLEQTREHVDRLDRCFKLLG